MMASLQRNYDSWLNITAKATILQTDLPKLSTAVQHKKKDGVRTMFGQRERERKLTERVPVLNSKRVF